MRVVRGYLNERSVLEIFAARPRASAVTGAIPPSTVHCRALATQYHVSNKTIRDIWNQNSWFKLTEPFNKPQEPQDSEGQSNVTEALNEELKADQTEQRAAEQPTATPAGDNRSTSNQANQAGVFADIMLEFDTDLSDPSSVSDMFDFSSEIDGDVFPEYIDANLFPDLSSSAATPTCWLLDYIQDTLSSCHNEDPIRGDGMSRLTSSDLRITGVEMGNFSENRRFGWGPDQHPFFAEDAIAEDEVCK